MRQVPVLTCNFLLYISPHTLTVTQLQKKVQNPTKIRPSESLLTQTIRFFVAFFLQMRLESVV